MKESIQQNGYLSALFDMPVLSENSNHDGDREQASLQLSVIDEGTVAEIS